MPGSVLVIGGAGFLGSHTCKALSRRGYLPVTIDDLSAGDRQSVKWGPLYEVGLADTTRLTEIVSEHRPVATIIHAAKIAVGESVENPAMYYRNNVTDTLTAIDALRASGMEVIVFTSSAAVYGEPHQVPIPETHGLRPTSPYGRTKVLLEEALRDYARAYGLRSWSLRCFNCAGGDPELEIGELHEPETHFIPLVLDAALGYSASVRIFGDDYDTADGTCLRDYVHVIDLAEAHISAMERLLGTTNPVAEICNLASGTGISNRGIIEAASRVTGCSVPYSVEKRRAGDPAVLVADVSVAQERLNWSPRFPDIETIIEHAWNWHRLRRAHSRSEVNRKGAASA